LMINQSLRHQCDEYSPCENKKTKIIEFRGQFAEKVPEKTPVQTPKSV
jgi:hypothetical protein